VEVFEVHFKNYRAARPYARHGIDLRRKFTYLSELEMTPLGLWLEVEIPEVNLRTGQTQRGKARLAVPFADIEYVLAFDDGTATHEQHAHHIGFIHDEDVPTQEPQAEGPVRPIE
jgi:hypothetical protein